jgi:hypothetical protein
MGLLVISWFDGGFSTTLDDLGIFELKNPSVCAQILRLIPIIKNPREYPENSRDTDLKQTYPCPGDAGEPNGRPSPFPSLNRLATSTRGSTRKQFALAAFEPHMHAEICYRVLGGLWVLSFYSEPTPRRRFCYQTTIRLTSHGKQSHLQSQAPTKMDQLILKMALTPTDTNQLLHFLLPLSPRYRYWKLYHALASAVQVNKMELARSMESEGQLRISLHLNHYSTSMDWLGAITFRVTC